MNSLILWFFLAINFQNPSVVAEEKVNLTVKFVDIDDPEEGKLLIHIYDRQENFLDEEETHREAVLEPKEEEIQTVFKNLKPGRYSVSVINDENGNEKMDLNFLNIPKEQFGFSNNPFLMGKPKWKDCSFELRNDTTITVEMQ